MGMVAISPHIASAFFVFYGRHGDVTLHALDRDISRQRVYREADAVALAVDGAAGRARQEELASQLAAVRQQIAILEERLRQAVVIDRDRQAVTAGDATDVVPAAPTGSVVGDDAPRTPAGGRTPPGPHAPRARPAARRSGTGSRGPR